MHLFEGETFTGKGATANVRSEAQFTFAVSVTRSR